MTGRAFDDCSAMILAAGLGTRLQPLTVDRAKAVVPFLNRPLLDYTLDWLRRCGFRQVVINLHHLPRTVRDVYGDTAFGLRLLYSVEEVVLGTAGGPRAALDRLGDRVLLVNGDIVATIAPGPLVAHHRAAGALATMALHTGEGARGYPQISVDETGRVVGIPGVSASADAAGSTVAEVDGREAGCFTGIHLVDRQVIERVPPETFCGMVDPVYAQLMAGGSSLHAIPLPGSWYEIGTPARYVECQIEALRREDFPLAFAGYRRVSKGAYVRGVASWQRAGPEPPFLFDEGVHVEEGAVVRGVVAGRRCFVGCGATVHDSVLLPGAWIGAGARVERCIVMEGARVPAGARFTDGVVEATRPVPSR